MNHHTLAIISILGSSLDVLGAMYLAYDLLGGEHGPLRVLTRGVTYGAFFGICYGMGLGPMFGAAAGITHGITLAWEFSAPPAETSSLVSGTMPPPAPSAGSAMGSARRRTSGRSSDPLRPAEHGRTDRRLPGGYAPDSEL